MHKNYMYAYYAQEMCLLTSRNTPIMLKKCTYYDQEMHLLRSKSACNAQEICLLCSRNAPITLKNVSITLKKCAQLLRSRKESTVLKIYMYAYYSVCLRNAPVMIRKCAYYAQEMCLLCSRNTPIMLKNCVYYAQEMWVYIMLHK